MSNSRKNLTSVLAGSLFLVVAYVTIEQIRTAFNSRDIVKQALNEKRVEQQIKINRGIKARKRLTEYEQRSLPRDEQGDQQIGHSLYQSWLSKLVGKAQFANLKLTGPQRRPQSQQTRNKIYQKLPFTIKARATLAQLTGFLYDFYHADHLHQIRKLHIAPIDNTRDLDIALTIEALILPEAKHVDQLNDKASTRLSLGGLSEYERMIIMRNVFGPPNLAPVLSPISDKTTKTGRPLSFTAQAKDGDEDDQLTYSLGPNSVEGALIDPKSGSFRWTPSVDQGPGKYQALVVVTDSGIPPQSARCEVSLTVVPYQLKFGAIRDKNAEPEKEFSFTVPLAESDPNATVRYALGDDAPTGASLDPSTGRFSWTPGIGDDGSRVTIAVTATDDSSRKREDRTTFQIAVASPKPKFLEPDFIAQNTFLTAIVEVSGKSEAWLFVRPKGTTIRVRDNQTFTAGNLTATVVRITSGKIVLKIGDQLVSLASGKSFADAEPLPADRL